MVITSMSKCYLVLKTKIITHSHLKKKDKSKICCAGEHNLSKISLKH